MKFKTLKESLKNLIEARQLENNLDYFQIPVPTIPFNRGYFQVGSTQI